MSARYDPRPILIVEDERIVALDLQQTLREFGFAGTDVASSADEALACAAARRPELVLMDIRINGDRDGIETAHSLKAQFDVPVVYLTAHADEVTLQRATATTPHGYLLKPIKAAELRSAVEVSLIRHDFERRQREREQWFAATLASIGDAVVAVDLDGRVAFMNPVAATLTGVAMAEGAGRPVAEVLHLDHAWSGPDLPVLQALRDRRTLVLDTAPLVNVATRQPRVIADSAAPVVDPLSHEVLGAVMVFRDVTDRERMRAQLEQTERLAALGTLAAGVAHEVNNPLTVVLANIEYVRQELGRRHESATEGAAPAPLAIALADVESAAVRIGQIVADLKAFARPPAADGGTVDVVATAEWALRATAHEFRTRARLVRELAAVPRVAADDVRLGQVLVNLLTNAAQAIAPGFRDDHTVTLTTRVDRYGRVVIEVRDDGPGIPEEVRPHIFEPFFTTKRDSGGTGLGLAICHGIVSSLGGELTAAPNPGGGTIMRVVLPAAPAVTAPAAVRAVDAPVGRARVLVVDDEALLLDVITRMLADHAVETTLDAREALAWLESGAVFDVVFVDVTMPTMSGVAFFEAVRQRLPALAPRVVFMSGGVFERAFETFLDGLPNRRVGKPFRSQDLRAAVGAIVGELGPAPSPGRA